MISNQKIGSTLALLAILGTAQGQTPAATEGKVIYERKINMHRRITDESMKNMIPEFSTSKAELSFAGDESIFQNVKEEEDIRDNADVSGNRFVMKFGGGDAQTYKNYGTGQTTEQREMGPRKYLIADSLPELGWHLQPDTMTIKGYLCKKAIGKNRQGNAVIAWYTETIPVPTGPETLGGLPGLILQVDINNAEMVFTPLQIITGNADRRVVKQPTDGKKITRKEFQKMMEEEYGVKPGGGPTIRIIRN